MRHPSEFVRAPKSFFTPGRLLRVNVYVYMPKNKSIIFLRRAGETLTAEDCASLARIPDPNLLVLKSERQLLLEMSTEQLGKDVASATDKITSPAVQQNAASILSSIELETDPEQKASSEVAREMLATVPKLVQEMIQQFKKTPSVKQYEKVLQSMKNGADPLVSHNQQVSALAVLMMLTIGNATTEDLSELGTAGLIHDLGLSQIPKPLLERHLIGEEEFTASEKLIYMRHPDLSIDIFSKSDVTLTSNTVQIVQLHHEAWDGTGFKGIHGYNIFWPARILRVADDIVAAITHPKNVFGFKEALAFLTIKHNKWDVPVYDPDILAALGRAIKT